jgi:1,4-alpha-glucan branching enzyme
VLAFARTTKHGERVIACVMNLSPMPREQYRIGLPRSGRWREVLNTDSEIYGGGNVGNLGTIDTDPLPWGGQMVSAALTLPPLGALWLVPTE